MHFNMDKRHSLNSDYSVSKCSASLFLSGPPKTEAQLKKEAKKREKMEKFQQKKEIEEKKKQMQSQSEVRLIPLKDCCC